MWQRQWLAAGEEARQLAYWREALGDTHPPLELPTDHPRPAHARYRVARHAFVLPAALVTALARGAESHGVTRFMQLLTALQVLLARLSGEYDVRVGVPVANRQRPETAGVVGFFINILVLRNRLDAHTPLAAALARTRAAALGVQAHPDLPFERLVEALRPERSAVHSPMFQVLFNHLREDYRALEPVSGLRFDGWALAGDAVQFELVLDTHEHPDGRVDACFSYAAELFEPATIARFGRAFVAVLDALAHTLEVAVGEVALVDAAEVAQLRAWGGGAPCPPWQGSVPALIARQAAARPAAVALVCDGAELRYAALQARAEALAQRLRAHGVWGPRCAWGWRSRARWSWWWGCSRAC